MPRLYIYSYTYTYIYIWIYVCVCGRKNVCILPHLTWTHLTPQTASSTCWSCWRGRPPPQRKDGLGEELHTPEMSEAHVDWFEKMRCLSQAMQKKKKTILAIRLFKNEIRIFESRTPCSPKTGWVTQPDRDRQRSSWRTHGAALPDATDWLIIQLITTSLSDFGQWLQILRKTISSIGLMLWKSRPGRGSTWRPAETDGACLEAPGAWQTDKVHRNSKTYVVNI